MGLGERGGADLGHLRTRPDMPRTNRKAERLIQTWLRASAWAKPHASSSERRLAIHPWLVMTTPWCSTGR
jgi:hypothetical protein